MGKIYDDINSLIMGAMKSKDTVKTNAYKNLKAKMLEFKTAKVAKPLDDAAEITLIKKMVTELKNDADLFEKNGRTDLSVPALDEAKVLEAFLPEEATPEQIITVINNWRNENNVEEIDNKSMGQVIKYVKATLPNADGAVISNIIKTKNYI